MSGADEWRLQRRPSWPPCVGCHCAAAVDRHPKESSMHQLRLSRDFNYSHYKTNSRIIRRIIRFGLVLTIGLVVRTIGLIVRIIRPWRLVIHLSAWYFQGGNLVVRSALSCPRAAKCRTTGLGAITGLTGSHPSYPSSNLRSSSMLEPPVSSAAAQTSPDSIVPR